MNGGYDRITRRRVAAAVTLLGGWLLVQVPEKDMKLTDPGHPMAPITQYKRIREFDSYEQCDFARANALQDAMNEGSDAMAAQSSNLRCVSADQIAGTPAPTGQPTR
jgi:hypothetical protein